MAHSYVSFRDREIHLKDVDLIPIMALVLEESNTSHALSLNILKLMEQWRSTLSGYAPGCINCELDQHVTDADSIGQLLILFEKVEIRIQKSGEKMPANEVSALATDTMIKYFDDYPTLAMNSTLGKIKGLLLEV